MSVAQNVLKTDLASVWPRFRLNYVWRDEVYDGCVLCSTAHDVMLDYCMISFRAGKRSQLLC